MMSTRVVGLAVDGAGTVVETTAGAERADVVVSCAGLQADRVATMAAGRLPARIVPFRGEYYQLAPEASALVRGLVYPVPDPAFPFLGVHLTRGVDGTVHVGPNAVLALEREGYGRRSARWADVADLLSFPGFWRMGRHHVRAGVAEMRRAMSRRLFAASAARLVPALTEADLRPAGVGVRAQAVRRDGTIVDDFLVLRRGGSLHVLNAPSPAATSALHIGEHVAGLAIAAAG
jgi:L-2-hydroxyglutarate oxidase